jgi:hypothetical protein
MMQAWTDRPANPGWYWWKRPNGPPIVVKLDPTDIDHIHKGEWIGEWKGPLTCD